MTLDTFFNKFDKFADAPDAVAKMRALILNLAIRGKLVAQDGSEESAEKSLTKVLRDRARLDKSLRVKAACSVDADIKHTPGLPNGWCYASPDQLTTFNKNALTIGPFGSSLLKSDYTDDGIPLVFVRDIRSEFSSPEIRFVSAKKAEELASHTVRPGDLLVTKMGDPPGDTAIYPQGRANAIITADCIKLTPHADLVVAEYLMFAIRASQIAEQFTGITLGVAQQKVSLGRFRCIAVPLPPLAEQKRIVAKVEELMALCDRLEAQQQERDEQVSALARASLARFAEAPTPANLNFLFHKSYSISPADLRKLILTLAIQGKLVPQDAKDEPASKLLARIEKKKAALIAAKQIRQGKISRPQGTADAPTSLPQGWTWVHVDTVFFKVTDGTHFTPRYVESGIRFVSAKDIVGGKLTFDRCKFITREEHDELYRRCNPEYHDIVITKSGSIGSVALVEDRGEFSLFESLALLKFDQRELFSQFLVYILRHTCEALSADHIRGMAVKHLHLDILRGLGFALPPLAEQRRIAAKADQLMALVDQLETQLAASRTIAKNLLEVIVAELTA